jgi:hypothetical protein
LDSSLTELQKINFWIVGIFWEIWCAGHVMVITLSFNPIVNGIENLIPRYQSVAVDKSSISLTEYTANSRLYISLNSLIQRPIFYVGAAAVPIVMGDPFLGGR